MKLRSFFAILTIAAIGTAFAQEPDGKIHPLLPGIKAEPLPVDLPNCNNLLYRHDGKLVALGYRGDIYLLSDTDGDGAEDTVEVFWESEGRITGQIGMDLAPKGSPHGNAVFIAAKGKILMLADQDGDDRAEIVQTLAEGWPPARAGVDVTGLAYDDRDGSVWFGLGVRLYNDAYELAETGVAQNNLSSERGAIHRIAPDFRSREKICTGIRWPIALRFNRHGDLFCTDQEGATWVPNGNPFDELLVIESGRHYGFPPRHPRHLPNVIDEPSVYDYGPQHQSTCGMNFNEPVNGGPVFGPDWWRGDALVAGESRGKIYRTKVVKTPHGYVAHNETLARLGMLTIDLCVTPEGELRVCTHSGPPDWGTGPEGKGRIWRLTFEEAEMPQPVLSWRHRPDEVRVVFDGPLPENWHPHDAFMERSPNARAGDRHETMRPPYEVVKRQMAEERQMVTIKHIDVISDRHGVVLKTDSATPERSWLHFEMPGPYALQADTNGVETAWEGTDGCRWSGWLPHVDLEVARSLSEPSPVHGELWKMADRAGTLTLKSQLDLWQMLHPKVQEGAQLDYEYPPETVTVTFASSNARFVLVDHEGKAHASDRGHVTHDLTFTFHSKENTLFPFEVRLDHPGGALPDFTAYWSTTEDERLRPFPTRRLVMPWAVTGDPAGEMVPNRPEVAGGNWNHGRELFFGNKALCSSCHEWNGEGTHIGPDLSQLSYRDFASVLRDIHEPSAAINPDYPTHAVELFSGEQLIAVPREDPNGNMRLGIGPGTVVTVKKTDIKSSRPVAASLMPAGLDTILTDSERRDLMTFLLMERPVMRDYATLPRDGVDHPPRPRTREELTTVMAGIPNPPLPLRPLRIVLVAGPKDHGFGEHDYPRWQHVWSRLMSLAEKTEISTAWKWPNPLQWEEAHVLVFFKRGDWTRERSAQLDRYLQRGGGAVFIHWACEAGQDAQALANMIGLASNSASTKYRHGLVDLTFRQDPPHPVLRGFDQATFHDESYWNLVGNPSSMHVLATGPEEGADRPLFWVLERNESRAEGKEPGRVFVSIFGHYSWTFDDPLFRTLLLRGIAWSAHEPVDRFNNLIEAGLTIDEE